MTAQRTISSDYLQIQQELHKNPHYGEASIGYAPIVKEAIRVNNITSLSDYGAGKQNLIKALRDLGVPELDYRPYDPAFPEYGPPQPADLVCCIDVLEHIEPEYLDAVLKDLAAITKKTGFFTIATTPAKKTLIDGRNAHLILQPSSWWLPKLCEYFEIMHLVGNARGFWLIVQPKAG